MPVNQSVVTPGTGPLRVDALAAQVPLVFDRRSCGDGAKGEKRYDWALAEVTWPGGADGGPRRGWTHLLLVRRSVTDPSRAAYFAVHARAGTPIGEIIRVMGLRWSVEDCFETAKSDCGLDHYEVRTWDAWHRHITLALAALAFLTVTATRADGEPPLPVPAGQDKKSGTPEKGAVTGSSAS